MKTTARSKKKKLEILPVSTELIGISFKGNRAQINANSNYIYLLKFMK